MHALRQGQKHNATCPFQNVPPCPTFNPFTPTFLPLLHVIEHASGAHLFAHLIEHCNCLQELALGEVYAEFGCHGWVHSVAWSPSGSSMAFAGHDSSLHVVNFPAKGTLLCMEWKIGRAHV